MMIKKRVFSGIQPTGGIHIGNYLGAIRQWVKMQDDFECLYCIVDLHAMTTEYAPEDMRKNTLEMAAIYLAAGLDPKKAILYNQSAVDGHAYFAWMLNCLTPMGWLNRMTQFKDKAKKRVDETNLGLYAYPVLQAADILLFKADAVPIGEDQKQHVELCRDIAGAFNRRFGQDYFTLPEPLVSKDAPRVMSLRDGSKKMSKSDPSEYARIHMGDDDDTIALKIRKARTDADPISADFTALDARPEAKNLLTIYSVLRDQSLAKTCADFEGAQFSQVKKDLTEALIETIAPIRTQYQSLRNDQTHLENVLRDGANKARAIADTHLKEIRELTGLFSS